MLESEKKNSYLKNIKDSLKKTRTQIMGTIGIGAAMLFSGGCSLANLEARIYDDNTRHYSTGYYNTNDSLAKGEPVELMCEVLKGDYDNDGVLDPLLRVVEGNHEGMIVKLHEYERFGNRDSLREARNMINSGRYDVKVFGEIKGYDDGIAIVNPKFLAFNDFEGQPVDSIYTDIDPSNTSWWNQYDINSSVDWCFWFGPGGHRFNPWSRSHSWFRQDWDGDGIRNGFDRTPFGGYINPHAHLWWFNFHHHHTNYGHEHDFDRRTRIVINKEWFKKPGVINYESLSPRKPVVRIHSKSGDLSDRVRRVVPRNNDRNDRDNQEGNGIDGRRNVIRKDDNRKKEDGSSTKVRKKKSDEGSSLPYYESNDTSSVRSPYRVNEDAPRKDYSVTERRDYSSLKPRIVEKPRVDDSQRRVVVRPNPPVVRSNPSSGSTSVRRVEKKEPKKK
jgi:hypothetical protein